ncbi:hypothetical protein [Thiocapsa rosea]|uniref:ScoMcrA-like DNA sulfur-binding domain-containing protein n=1 Tax=Thiocapsa rosea TaxID=69360 RepID=A0A495VE07_9GAMM|nr:hypothetical protein [Thiocapsa rosea]RKT46607.1 hypothetical protein BDD21_4131 [Thiocapsa rosea]
MERFSVYDHELRALFARFYPYALEHSNTHYPFGRLEGDGLWEIEDSENLKRTSVGHLSKSELLARDIHGGFTADVFEALTLDRSIAYRITTDLISQFFDASERSSLLACIGMPTSWEMESNSENECADDSERKTEESTRNLLVAPFPSGAQHEIQGATKMNQNGLISYFNSLHNIGASGANALAESQALNEYFSEIYEPFEIVDAICDVLTAGRDHVVVLTGHAGDGKSTVALDVLKRIRGLSPKDPLTSALKEVEIISHPASGSRVIHILKDMSELSAAVRLQKLEQSFEEPGSWLIVSNTGPLLNTLREFSERREALPDIESRILAYLNRPYAKHDIESHVLKMFPKDMLILNMARLDNVSLGARVLTRMINHSAWAKCDACVAQSACPLVLNRRALKATEGGAEERVRWIYQRLNAYEQRLTLRQMVAQLAFAMTGGMTCKEAKNLVLESPSEGIEKGTDGLEGVLFSEGFFGYRNGKPVQEAGGLTAVQLLRRQIFGGPVAVDFERELSSSNGNGWAILSEWLKPLSERWRLRGQESPGVQWRFAQRRMLYVFGQPIASGQAAAETYWATFLQSPRLRDFDLWATRQELIISRGERGRLCRACLRVLLEIFSGFSAGQFRQDQERLYLTLRRPDRAVVQPTQFVMATLSFQDFDLAYDEPRRLPVLQFRNGVVKLPLTLPLLDFIENRIAGDLGSELARIHLAQLEWFRAELLRVLGGSSDRFRIQLLRAGIDGQVHAHRYLLDNERQVLEVEQ